jgi:hypothetical protein
LKVFDVILTSSINSLTSRFSYLAGNTKSISPK